MRRSPPLPSCCAQPDKLPLHNPHGSASLQGKVSQQAVGVGAGGGQAPGGLGSGGAQPDCRGHQPVRPASDGRACSCSHLSDTGISCTCALRRSVGLSGDDRWRGAARASARPPCCYGVAFGMAANQRAPPSPPPPPKASLERPCSRLHCPAPLTHCFLPAIRLQVWHGPP